MPTDDLEPAPAPPHPLLQVYLDAAEGRFPEVDGVVEVLPLLAPGIGCVASFTGHAIVATDRTAAETLAQGPDGFGEAVTPDFLRWLAGPGNWIGCIDASLVGRGVGGPPALPETTAHDAHSRVHYARALRTDVRVFGDERGFVTISKGLAGRREFSVELTNPAMHGKGEGRSLLRDALTMVPAGEPVFAAVSPGNARSLRAFLSLDFTPLGSEVVFRTASRTAP